MMETKKVRHFKRIPWIGFIELPDTPRMEYLMQHRPIVPKEYTTLKKVIITALVVMLSGLFGLLFREPELPAALGFYSAIVMGVVWFVQDLRITASRDRLFSWSCEVYDEYCKHTQPKQPSKPRHSWTEKDLIALGLKTKINSKETGK